MVNTINPAECDRTTVYTGECRNYSDTAWVPFQSGRRRAPDAPDYPWLVDSGTGSFWTRDTHVRNLVPLVPGPAPAVSRADIEKAVAEWVDDAPEIVNEVWSLVSGSDPAVFIVRESDLPEAQRLEDGSWAATPGFHHYGRLAEPAALRKNVKNWMEDVAQAEAIARAIEAGQATDPLLDKAQEFAALADWELTDREAELLHTVAAHVLGQEADDE